MARTKDAGAPVSKLDGRWAILLFVAACASTDGVTDGAGASAADAGAGGAGSTSSSAGGHGCFSTEATCNGACIDTDSHPLHCGGCGQPCVDGPNQTGICVDGDCSSECAAGFALDQGVCKNFLGAHEPWPVECPGCATPNAVSAACGCPVGTSALSLAVQSDCPGVPMRSATTLDLCLATAASDDSDFGGAYQVDDFAGWCGATAQCRVGNPLAGGACACPPGFDDVISLRSIFRLPCDGSEGGSLVFLCGKRTAPFTTFAGAYQFDDFAPQCRTPNPWTGDCTCPPGSVDRVFRVMVDGAPGLYGSTMHLCTP